MCAQLCLFVFLMRSEQKVFLSSLLFSLLKMKQEKTLLPSSHLRNKKHQNKFMQPHELNTDYVFTDQLKSAVCQVPTAHFSFLPNCILHTSSVTRYFNKVFMTLEWKILLYFRHVDTIHRMDGLKEMMIHIFKPDNHHCETLSVWPSYQYSVMDSHGHY